jgi:tetratricopeptide (TPR) repeat protein
MGETDIQRGLREARQNLKSGRVREALARLFHLTEKYPDDGEVRGELAVALLAQGRDHAEHGKLELAREDFRRSIRFSETPEGHLYLGRLHQIRGEYEDAFAEFTRALDLDDNIPAVHENLGLYFLEIQDWEQAAKAFGTALACGATGRDAYIGLWRAYTALERLDKAHDVIEDALGKMPDDDTLHVVAGITASMRHETEEAEDHWLKAAKLRPKNVDAHFYLAGLAAARGDRDETLKKLRTCAAIDVERTRSLWKQDAGLPHPKFSGYRGDEDVLDILG